MAAVAGPVDGEINAPAHVAGDHEDGGVKTKEESPTDSRAPPRKRRRIVISCTECHRRKQKCDRKLPCTNCISRGKQDACHYDQGAPTMKAHGPHGVNGTGSPDSSEGGQSIPTKVADFGYSQTGASTLGFLKKIEGSDPREPLSRLETNAAQTDHFNTRERYKSLIRQLPARTYVEKLVELYFVHFNWQYYGIDEDVFRRQLQEWNNLPFSLLTNGGPHALPPDLRAFPALLFQVLATALLVLPSGSESDSNSDPTFDSLKYAGNMTFEDLALDYSESGVAITSLLGKRQMSLTTVIAGFLRAAFLKYMALVTEAWHALGNAIRDAQEIGLHRQSLDPRPKSDTAEAVLENQWEIERRRRLWMTLVAWDAHTGVVLGRPLTIDVLTLPVIKAVDAPLPKDRLKTPVIPRSDHDPPTPLTRSLWAYELMMPLRDILSLEKDGPCPKDFTKVDEIHQKLSDLVDSTPPYFRLENPDTRWDHLPECYWLPMVRATLPQLSTFNFMALHRPYIFTRPKSRTEALKASLDMLHAQQQHFASIEKQQYKTFSLFFGTFDAIVLMASIYILFPKEHPELVNSAMQHFQWSVERFEAMSERNQLAKAALSVLNAILIRLRRSLVAANVDFGESGISMNGWSGTTGKSTNDTPITASTEAFTPQQYDRASAANSTSATPGTTTSSGYVTSSAGEMYAASAADSNGVGGLTSSVVSNPQQQPQQDFDWSIPPDFDWSTIQPILATSDLVYNDLLANAQTTRAMDHVSRPAWAAANAVAGVTGDISAPGAAQVPQAWQFEGEFGNDSVWNLFNQYPPS